VAIMMALEKAQYEVMANNSRAEVVESLHSLHVDNFTDALEYHSTCLQSGLRHTTMVRPGT
jgi:hypothetical protein